MFAAIVYETLYKNVFKLPDIEYTVEIMLHATDDLESKFVSNEIEYANDDEYATHIVFEDGRKFQLDRPGKQKEYKFLCPNIQYLNVSFFFSARII